MYMCIDCVPFLHRGLKSDPPYNSALTSFIVCVGQVMCALYGNDIRSLQYNAVYICSLQVYL